ncbi:MAG TPA: hypothetical protein PK323_14060 [Bacteroidia bacterium]|nr:hypothetical protein [Bacteroidia bacterium]
MYSIIAKKPKIDNEYCLLHINQKSETNILSYNLFEHVDDKVIEVNINVGFKILPHFEYYSTKIVQELVSKKKLKLQNQPVVRIKNNNETVFKCMVLEEFQTLEHGFTMNENHFPY